MRCATILTHIYMACVSLLSSRLRVGGLQAGRSAPTAPRASRCCPDSQIPCRAVQSGWVWVQEFRFLALQRVWCLDLQQRLGLLVHTSTWSLELFVYGCVRRPTTLLLKASAGGDRLVLLWKADVQMEKLRGLQCFSSCGTAHHQGYPDTDCPPRREEGRGERDRERPTIPEMPAT